MRSCFKILAFRIGTLALTVLLGGLLTAVLVRVSPGFLVDERELDPRLNEASRRAIQQQHDWIGGTSFIRAGREGTGGGGVVLSAGSRTTVTDARLASGGSETAHD